MSWFYLGAAVVLAVTGAALGVIGVVGLGELIVSRVLVKGWQLPPLFLLLGAFLLRAAWTSWRRFSSGRAT